MATSGSLTYNFYKTGGIDWTFSWERTSYSPTNKTSTITWHISCVAIWNGAGSQVQHAAYEIVVNGTTYKKTYEIPRNGSVTVNDVYGFTLQHDASGQGVSFSYYDAGPPSFANNDINKTYYVDAIPVPIAFISAPNFNDEQSPTITYVGNNLIDKLEAYITFEGESAAVVQPRTISASAGSYIFPLTSAERKALRQGITSGISRKVTYYLRTTINGAYYYDQVTKLFSLINYKPTINPSVTDVNSATADLTGDPNNVLVRYKSTARINTGAVARKEATIETQRITNGSKVLEIEDTGSTVGEIDAVESNTFYISVKDNRGNSENEAVIYSETFGKKFIPYVKLTSALKLDYLTLAGDLGLTITGAYFHGSFGAEDNYLAFKYSLIKDGSEIGTFGMPIDDDDINYDGNTYTATYTITGLDPDSSYEVCVDVIDALMHVQSNAEAISATPVFDWGKTDFNHNTNVSFANEKSIIGTRADGSTFRAIELCNGSGHTVINWDSYDQESSDTEVYGNHVKIAAKNGVFINGREYGSQNILWSGASPMGQYHSLSLKDNISNQPNGIVLVFSLYRYNADTDRWDPVDASIQSFFVSKKEVELLPNAPHTFFLMINSGFSVIGAKYIYIDDKTLTGQATNTTNSTNNNMTFQNNSFVLRYVIGV